MSLMDRMKEGFSTLFGTTRRTSHLPSLLQDQSKHKVIIIDEADNTTSDENSFSERVLRSSLETVDLSSLATTRTKLLNRYIHAAVLLSFLLRVKKK